MKTIYPFMGLALCSVTAQAQEKPYYPDMVFRGNEIKQVRLVGKAREVKRIL